MQGPIRTRTVAEEVKGKRGVVQQARRSNKHHASQQIGFGGPMQGPKSRNRVH